MQIKYELIVYKSEWKDYQIELLAQQLDTEIQCIGIHDRTDDQCAGSIKGHQAIVIACSDAGIREANEHHIPVLALRNPEYEMLYGRQSLFGAPVLLEELKDVDWYTLALVYCRANQIPVVIGETARCQLRELAETDIPAFFQLTNGRINEGSLHVLNLSERDYYDFWRSYIKNQYAFYGYGLWLITAEDKRIGLAGFSNASYPFLDDAKEERMELSYWIAPDHRRSGYAFEVCDFLVHYVKDRYDIETLFLFAREENTSSVRLAQRLGFVFREKYDLSGGKVLEYEKHL